MKSLKDKQENQKKDLVLLQETREINQNLVNLFKDCEYLFQQYKEYDKETNKKDDSIVKIAISILNSILYQRRVFFCITRDGVKNLVKNDKNWKINISWANDYYKSVIRFLTYKDDPTIRQIKYRGYNSRKPIMFEVIDPDLIEMITIDAKQQKKESI